MQSWLRNIMSILYDLDHSLFPEIHNIDIYHCLDRAGMSLGTDGRVESLRHISGGQHTITWCIVLSSRSHSTCHSGSSWSGWTRGKLINEVTSEELQVNNRQMTTMDTCPLSPYHPRRNAVKQAPDMSQLLDRDMQRETVLRVRPRHKSQTPGLTSKPS